MFWFCGHEACGILAPQPGIEPTVPALEGKILTTELLGKSLFFFFFNDYNYRRVRTKTGVNATKTDQSLRAWPRIPTGFDVAAAIAATSRSWPSE